MRFRDFAIFGTTRYRASYVSKFGGGGLFGICAPSLRYIGLVGFLCFVILICLDSSISGFVYFDVRVAGLWYFESSGFWVSDFDFCRFGFGCI